MELRYTHQRLENLRRAKEFSAEDIMDFLYLFFQDIREESGKRADQCTVKDSGMLMRRMPGVSHSLRLFLEKNRGYARDEDERGRLDRLLRKIADTDRELEQARERISRLERKERQLTEKLQAKQVEQAEEQKLSERCAALEQELAQMKESQLAGMCEQERKLQAELSELQKRRDALSQELEQRKREISALQDKTREFTTERDAQTKAFADAQQELQKLQDAQRQLQSKQEGVRKAAEHLREQNAQFGKANEELLRQRGELEQVRDGLQAAFSETKKRIEQLTQDNVKLEQESAASADKLRELRQRRESMKSMLQQLADEIASCKESAAACSQECADAQVQLAEEKKEVAAKKSEAELLHGECEKQRKLIEEARARQDTLVTMQNERNGQRELLEKKNGELQLGNDELDSGIRALTAENAGLERLRQQKLGEKSRKERDKLNLQENISQLDSACDALGNEILELENSVRTRDFSGQKQQMEQRRGELQRTLENYQEAERQLHALEDEIEQAHTDFETKKASIVRVREQRQEQCEKQENELQDLQKSIAEYEDKVASMQEESRLRGQERDRLSAEIKRLRDWNESLDAKRYQQQITHMQRILDKLENVRRNLLADLDSQLIPERTGAAECRKTLSFRLDHIQQELNAYQKTLIGVIRMLSSDGLAD